MRLSLGSVAALAAALLVSFAFWPENRAVQGPPQLFAQNKSKPAQPQPARAAGGVIRPAKPTMSQSSLPVPPQTMLPALIVVDHPLSSDVGQNPRIEAALDATTDFMIDPQPLKEAIEFIAQRFHIPVLFDTRTLEDASIDTSTEVKLPTVGLKLRQMLTLLFQQLPQPLGFDVQDGVLRISTIEAIRQNTYVVVYDCRDLIHLSSIYPGAGFQTQTRQQSGAMGGGGGVFSADPEPIDISQKGAASSGKSQQKANPSAKPTCAAAEIPLIRVIRYAGDANDWQDEEGGGPKVTEIGGLLVVNQNSMVHEQIKRILADLRRMRTEGAFATLETPRTAVPSKPSAGSKESGL